MNNPRNRDHQYIWIRSPRRGPLGKQQWDMVSRVDEKSVAAKIKKSLENLGHTVYIRSGNAKYPCT